MIEAIFYNPMFGISLTFISYQIAMRLANRFRSPLLNPIALASFMCIIFLVITKIPLEAYRVGGDFLLMLIFPATICIAVSVYRQLHLLKKHFVTILIGCTVGAATSIISVLLLSNLFGLDELIKISLIPKSVTSAIALELSSLIGGEVSLTIFAVMVTGTTGVITIPLFFKYFKIQDPIIQGISLGTSSHVIGTSKALEYGPIQGGMSGIAIFITGMVTVLISIFIF